MAEDKLVLFFGRLSGLLTEPNRIKLIPANLKTDIHESSVSLKLQDTKFGSVYTVEISDIEIEEKY